MSKPASKRQQAKSDRQQREKRERLITISVIAFVALLFAVGLILPNLRKGGVGKVIVPEGMARLSMKDNTAGNPNAPVKIEEFSDFRCTHCRGFWQDQEVQLINSYINTGKVYFTYTPLAFINEESKPAAEAAYCAMEQGKFWDYHDMLFANYDMPYSTDRLVFFAGQLKLNEKDFKTCLESNQYADQMQANAQKAKDVKIAGTPTFVVNGKLVDRTQLFQAIDDALAGK